MGGHLLLFLWCLAVRGPTFLRSVIDWDESLYLLIARGWSEGAVPYTGLWDHKPVGVYLILRAFAWTDDLAIFGMRLAAVVFVFLSALCLRRIAIEFYRSAAAGTTAAVLYPVLSLHLGGSAANTEVFFTAFTLLGLSLLLRLSSAKTARAGRSALLLGSGFAWGAAFQVKYLVLVELGFLAAMFALLHRSRGSLRRSDLLLPGLGFVLPTALVAIYFLAAGAFAEFVDANLLANLRHAEGAGSGHPTLAAAKALLRFLGCSLPVAVVGGIARLVVDGAQRMRDSVGLVSSPALDLFLGGWLVMCLVEASLTGKFYPHYLLPALAPLTLLAAAIPVHLGLRPGRFRAVLCAALVAALPLCVAAKDEYVPWIREQRRGGTDDARALALEVSRYLGDPPSLYVANHQPILYLLTNTTPPTRFAFPPFLFDPHFSSVARVDYRREFSLILARKPACVLIRADGNPRVTELVELLRRDHSRHGLRPDVDLWCRSNSPRAP